MFQDFWEITTLNLSHAVPVKTKVEISQIFEAFFKYMNHFKSALNLLECYLNYFLIYHKTLY